MNSKGVGSWGEGPRPLLKKGNGQKYWFMKGEEDKKGSYDNILEIKNKRRKEIQN